MKKLISILEKIGIENSEQIVDEYLNCGIIPDHGIVHTIFEAYEKSDRMNDVDMFIRYLNNETTRLIMAFHFADNHR